MLVGVLSDTHDSLENIRRALKVFSEAGVSAIIHLGDIISPFALKLIAESSKTPVEAVFGNNDGERIGLSKVALAYNVNIGDPPRVVTIAGRRILLAHGFGDPTLTYDVVRALAESRRWDAVLYGHTHEPRVEYVRGTLLLNPGDCSGYLNKPTVALLDLKVMRARLVEL